MEEKRQIWVRLGCIIEGTKDEIEKILHGDELALINVVFKGNTALSGESYIPEECIEEYNEDYGTHHPIKDVEFEL